MKSNHKNFVHLVALYTYCKMMHGAYSVKHQSQCHIIIILITNNNIIIQHVMLLNLIFFLLAAWHNTSLPTGPRQDPWPSQYVTSCWTKTTSVTFTIRHFLINQQRYNSKLVPFSPVIAANLYNILVYCTNCTNILSFLNFFEQQSF